MDLEWLLPEQIEQILRLCDLSSIHDPSLAANILEQHHWNFETALNDLVGQNDHQAQNQHQNILPALPPRPHQQEPQMEEQNEHRPEEEGFEFAPQHYHRIDAATKNDRTLLAQQNEEYEQMEKSYIAKLAEDQEWQQYVAVKEREFEQHRQELTDHVVSRPIQIKFRLATRSETQTFDLNDPVQKIFKYVSGHLREALEHKYAEFDLTQAFPAVSLRGKLTSTLEQVFGESNGEVLIVREL